MKKILMVLMMFLVSFLAGCSYRMDYEFSLKEVSTFSSGTKQVLATNCQDLFYSDPVMNINFLLTGEGFALGIKNVSAIPISILWDNATLVDQDGNSHRVIHKDVYNLQKNMPQPPTTILPDSSLKDIIYPADYVTWNDAGQFSGWQYKSIFSSGNFTRFMSDDAKKLIGKTFQFLLPLQTGDTRKDYLFIFSVTGGKIKPSN